MMLNVTDLDSAYRSQLQAALARERAAWHTIPWQTRAMLAWMETHAGGRLGAKQVARAWVWADLYLNHSAIIQAGGRPFGSAAEMRAALLEAWRQTVAETDLIIGLWDMTVGPPVAMLDDLLMMLPGDKVLVVGNHEFVKNRSQPKDYGSRRRIRRSHVRPTRRSC